ncbi:MAG: dihydrofolate reductase family protein [Thermoplasmata archaeon]|nr:dihydrofolate reductase family protein [Thermoplasmata archaeon]
MLILMFMTLDGIAEFPEYDEEVDSNDPDEGPPMWESRMESIDTLLLGRQTYEKWAGFWPRMKNEPSAGKFMREFSQFADRAEKVVFSSRLQSADWPNSRIVRGDLGEEIVRLKSAPGKDMMVGGPRLAQSFLERNLADELILELLPSIVGRGKPMFHVVGDPDHEEDLVPRGAPGRHDFKLLAARPLKSGSVLLHYARADPGGSRRAAQTTSGAD